jgi:hypothetical protein
MVEASAAMMLVTVAVDALSVVVMSCVSVSPGARVVKVSVDAGTMVSNVVVWRTVQHDLHSFCSSEPLTNVLAGRMLKTVEICRFVVTIVLQSVVVARNASVWVTSNVMVEPGAIEMLVIVSVKALWVVV